MSQAKIESAKRQSPELLVGAKRIAGYLFQNENKHRWIYERWKELGCFYWRGQIVARPDTIDQRLRAREAAALAEENT